MVRIYFPVDLKQLYSSTVAVFNLGIHVLLGDLGESVINFKCYVVIVYNKRKYKPFIAIKLSIILQTWGGERKGSALEMPF